MRFILDLCYLFVLLLLSPILLWVSARTGKYQDGLGQKVLGNLPERDGNAACVWFHAVSVGEVNLLETLIERFEMRRPDVECFVTTTTKTGYELAQTKYSKHTVAYCPLDFSWAVRRAMRRVRPSVFVLVELEIWPNLISAAKSADVPVAMINGRMSDRSFRGYRRIRWLMSLVFRKLQSVSVQTQDYADRFVALGVDHQKVAVTGSIKFDGAETNRRNVRTMELRKLVGVTDDMPVFLAGSTLEGEESLAIDVYRALADEFPELRLIIVPRHPERFDDVAALLDRSGLEWRRRKELTQSLNSDVRVLLVDTVGELGAWWGMADIAFVGGSMADRGGQNMIEPAAYGAAVCFGPNTANFRDVVQQLLAHDGAIVVRDRDELSQFVRKCLTHPLDASLMGSRARKLIEDNLGASDRTFEQLHGLLPPAGANSRLRSSTRSHSAARRSA